MRFTIATLGLVVLTSLPAFGQTISGRALLTANGPDITDRVYWTAHPEGARRLDLGLTTLDLESGFEKLPGSPSGFKVPRMQNVTLRAGLPGVYDGFNLFLERETTLRSGVFGDKASDLVFDAALVKISFLADPADSYQLRIQNTETRQDVTFSLPDTQIELLMRDGTYRISAAGLRHGPINVVTLTAGDILEIQVDGREALMEVVLGETGLWADGMAPLHLALSRPDADAFDAGPKIFVAGRSETPLRLSAGEWHAVLTADQGYGRTLFEGTLNVDPESDVLHVPLDYGIARPRLDMTDPDTTARLGDVEFPTLSIIETAYRGLPFAEDAIGPDGATLKPLLVVRPANQPADMPIALRFSANMDTFSVQSIPEPWVGQMLDLTLRVGEGTEMCLGFYGPDMCPLAQTQ